MHPFVRKYNLKPADSIVVYKNGMPFIRHYAVYLGTANDGRDLVMDTIPGRGVRLLTTRDFFLTYRCVKGVERFRGTEQDRLKRLRSAMRKVGMPYNLLAYNCEHLAGEVRTGKSASPQIKRSAVVTAVLLMLGGMRP